MIESGSDIFVEDKKRDYLIKTFSRTKRKDYENYILNSIWNKINRLDIQPVTQQYIKTTSGKYFLLVLYFPQLNVGVECDEYYHANNKDNDETRKLSIEEVLGVIDENSDFKLFRIKAYESIQSINSQIDELVLELNQRIERSKTIIPWAFQTVFQFRDSITKITLSDHFRYRTLLEVAQMVGKNYKGNQRAYFPIKSNYYAWCPQLSVVKDGKIYYFGRKNWVNTLSEDWETITEAKMGDKIGTLKSQSRYLRVTFVKSKDIFGKDNYRFIGIYKFNEEQSTHKQRIYNRIATEFKIK